MRINLKNINYNMRHEVKRWGAKWDPARKTWYIENVEDLTPFMPYLNLNKRLTERQKK